MYVERQLSEATAKLTGSRGVPMKIWVTNEYQHSGIRDDGYRILDRYACLHLLSQCTGSAF